METIKSLDLESVIKNITYEKSLTLTATEIHTAIAEALTSVGIEYANTLPTGENIKDKIYLIPDNDPQTDNTCDVWAYDKINSRWEHLDSLKFNISDYTKIEDIIDNLTSSLANKPLSANQGRILKGLIDTKSDNTHVHGSISNTGTLNSDISSVNKVVVTDENNNVKTITRLPQDKVTHQDISGKVNTSDIKDDLTSSDTNKPLSANQGNVLKVLVDGKVDKITGKGLSTEDYTTSEKNKLANIESEANKITKTSELTNDSGFLTSHQDITGKLDKTQGTNNNGKFLKVGVDGNVTLETVNIPSTVNDITDNNTYTNLGTSANATQSVINAAIDAKFGNIISIIAGTGS